MKAIMVMFDSLNKHMLEPYGCNWTDTPNFKRLAEKTITFENFYVGSMPCMPARRELHTGRLNFLHRSWGPIEPFDDSMPEILKKNKIYTHLISDHQHYWEDGGATYHSRYNTWEIIRGQEGDTWKASVKDPVIPNHVGQVLRQDYVNREYIQNEQSQPQTICFDLGLEFLEKNKNEDNWFLQLETFDPHEPFYSMEKYKKLYPHKYDGPIFDWPEYKKVTKETQEDIEHIRYEYASLLSMCDSNLGRIIDFMDANDMWKDTMLIVNTDHGFLLGEHDCFAKCVHPLYNEIANTPFFIWNPLLNISNEHRNSLAQTIDIAPTLLNYFNVDVPKDMQGIDISDIIKQDTNKREALLFGIHGGQVNVTDGHYLYMRNYEEKNEPLYNYTYMPTHMRSLFSIQEMQTVELTKPFSFTKNCHLMKIKSFEDENSDIQVKGRYPNMLFDLCSDKEQKQAINDKAIEEHMIEIMVKLMKENDAPEEQYKRLGISNYV